jgi:hypothetical protein
MAWLLLFGLAVSNLRPAQAAPVPDWASNFNMPGANGNVRAIAQTVDAIYIAGDFTVIGSVTAKHIARYDKSAGTWSALGTGTNLPVRALAVIGSDLVAGGNFTSAGGTPANYIAKWNGSSWSALGSGTNRVSMLSR